VLLGRRTECEALDRLVDAIRVGESRALVLRGEAGVGKSALLQYMTGRASGCWVARAAFVQSEIEFPFAGLNQTGRSGRCLAGRVDRRSPRGREAAVDGAGAAATAGRDTS
jgi:ABC-type glutathione transport system ATPase component